LITPVTERRAPRTVAVTGAKGGVGKSNLALNVAVSLARWGRRVLLVDGDLGLANLDVLLGLTPAFTVEHLVTGEAELEDVLLPGPAGVRLLPAASGIPRFSRLDGEARDRVLAALSGGTAGLDDVVIDTGAGLGDATLSLQLAASRVLLVTTPEPTSLVDAYATLKVLRSADRDKPVDLVVNDAGDDREASRVHDQIARAAEHFLGCRPGLLGTVVRDPRVGEAVRRQCAVVELFPDCKASRCYERIALQLAREDASGDRSAVYWERLMAPVHEELMH
jgi:flagellar biosynthesis protein FlhG